MRAIVSFLRWAGSSEPKRTKASERGASAENTASIGVSPVDSGVWDQVVDLGPGGPVVKSF